MDTPTQSNDDVVVAQFEKNKKEEVRLSVGTFHGRRIINIRVYYKDDDGTWKRPAHETQTGPGSSGR